MKGISLSVYPGGVHYRIDGASQSKPGTGSQALGLPASRYMGATRRNGCRPVSPWGGCVRGFALLRLKAADGPQVVESNQLISIDFIMEFLKTSRENNGTRLL